MYLYYIDSSGKFGVMCSEVSQLDRLAAGWQSGFPELCIEPLLTILATMQAPLASPQNKKKYRQAAKLIGVALDALRKANTLLEGEE